jgi:CRISPR/Cas system CMR-associated protein Cmr5 small subunit
MNDKNAEFDFTGHVKNIEDVENVVTDVQETLTDSELEQAGLVKTSAFVRSKKSKNALRVKKHKEKKAQNGIKQVNVEIPEHHKETVKKLAKELCSGKDLKYILLSQDMTILQRFLVKLFF